MGRLLILILALIAGLIVAGFIAQAVWGWVIPDVFAGAVEQGILPATIELAQALKLMVLFSVFGLAQGVSSNRSNRR